MMIQSSHHPSSSHPASTYFPRIAAASAASSSSAVVLPGELSLMHYKASPSQRNNKVGWGARNIPKVVGAATPSNGGLSTATHSGLGPGLGAMAKRGNFGTATTSSIAPASNPGLAAVGPSLASVRSALGAAAQSAVGCGTSGMGRAASSYGHPAGNTTDPPSTYVVPRKQRHGQFNHPTHQRQQDSSPERSRPRSNASTRPSTRHQPRRRLGVAGQGSATEEEGDDNGKGKKQLQTSATGLSHLTLSSPTALLSSAPEWQAQFYRTKLCPFYVSDLKDPAMAAAYGPNIGNATGRCLNGDSCRFAHSFEELRPLPDLRKTKLCASFTKKQPCTNSKCPFAHSPEELRTSSSVFYKVTLCNFYKTGRCWNGSNCRFAHGADELRCAGDLKLSRDATEDLNTDHSIPVLTLREPEAQVASAFETRDAAPSRITDPIPPKSESQARLFDTCSTTCATLAKSQEMGRPELLEYTTDTGRTDSETEALKLIWDLSERLCGSSEALSEMSTSDCIAVNAEGAAGQGRLAEQLSAALYAVFMAPQNSEEASWETPLGPPPGLDEVGRPTREWSTQTQSPETVSRPASRGFVTGSTDDSSVITEDLLGLLMQFDTSNAQSLLSPQTRTFQDTVSTQSQPNIENWKVQPDWKSVGDWKSVEHQILNQNTAHESSTRGKIAESWPVNWNSGKSCASSTTPDLNSGEGSEKLASLVASYFDEATIQTDEELYDKLLDTVLYGAGQLELTPAI